MVLARRAVLPAIEEKNGFEGDERVLGGVRGVGGKGLGLRRAQFKAVQVAEGMRAVTVCG